MLSWFLVKILIQICRDQSAPDLPTVTLKSFRVVSVLTPLLCMVVSTVVVTKHGCRSKYDVSRLIHGPRAFNNIELVVARWTTSSPARGTIQLITDGGTMKDRSERLRAPVIRHDGYDRYNLTLFFDGIRRRLSASNLDHRLYKVAQN